MKLRQALALVAVASLPAAAIAQTSQTQQTQNNPGASMSSSGTYTGAPQAGDARPGGNTSGTSAGPVGGNAMRTAQGSVHGEQAGMGQMEMDHARKTMQLGALALESSRLAQQRSENEDVKEFASYEVKEQEAVADVLRSMMDPATTASAGNAGANASGNSPSSAAQRSTAPGGDASPNAMLDPRGREMIQKLQQAKGDAFDREYLKGQLQVHQELLQVQRDYLARGKNRENVSLAKLTSTQIQEHISLVEQLLEDMDIR